MQEKRLLAPEIIDGRAGEWAHFAFDREVIVVFQARTSTHGWKVLRIPAADLKNLPPMDAKVWEEVKSSNTVKVFGAHESLVRFARHLPPSDQATHKALEDVSEVLISLKDGKVRATFKATATSKTAVETAANPQPEIARRPVRKPGEKTKILIVDDSKTIRTILQKVFASDPECEVIGALENPLEVENFIAKNQPDVITLDIHMPGLNGVELLKRYLPKFPIPTVMISSISLEEGPLVLSALEAGAVDYLQKPSFEELQSITPILLEKVKSASLAKVHLATSSRSTSTSVRTSKDSSNAYGAQDKLLVIGSSTGGTEALRQILTALPDQIPPILIVQHIPPIFSRSFAERMDQLCPFEVQEAKDGDECLPNRVLIAPGGTQMSFVAKNNRWMVRVDENADKVNRHRPSVDYLFHSIPAEVAKKTVGVILTGMGADGAQGLLELRNAGSQTLGQDENSCVVYGMPQAAFKLGAVGEQVSLDLMATAIVRTLQKRKKAA